MFKLRPIIKWFMGPTIEESFENGRQTADKLLAEGIAAGRNPRDVANYIYAMGFGGFNETPTERAFDKGIQARLYELGYKDPAYWDQGE